jgi:hypothetical protein
VTLGQAVIGLGNRAGTGGTATLTYELIAVVKYFAGLKDYNFRDKIMKNKQFE